MRRNRRNCFGLFREIWLFVYAVYCVDLALNVRACVKQKQSKTKTKRTESYVKCNSSQLLWWCFHSSVDFCFYPVNLVFCNNFYKCFEIISFNVIKIDRRAHVLIAFVFLLIMGIQACVCSVCFAPFLVLIYIVCASACPMLQCQCDNFDGFRFHLFIVFFCASSFDK